jgi:hypothetical protein
MIWAYRYMLVDVVQNTVTLLHAFPLWYGHVVEWLRRWFGLVNRFTGSSLVVTTNKCNTFNITVIITHKVFNPHVKSSQVFYELPVAVSYRELNWTRSQSHIATDGRSVSHPWCRAPSGLMTRYLLLFDSCGLVIVGRPLWRGDESVFCQIHCLQ